MTTATIITQSPEYWEASCTRTTPVQVESWNIPESFLRAWEDYQNARVTDIPEDF